MSLYGGKLGGTTFIPPRDSGVIPSPDEARVLLESLKQTGQADLPGTVLSVDGRIGAEPDTDIGADATEGHQALREVRVITVYWTIDPDAGGEHRWTFYAEPWKGRAGLLAALRQRLLEIGAP